MTPFAYLLVAHLMGDYLFQTNWMATYKTTKWSALIVHSLVYTACLTIVAFLTFGALPLWAVAVIFFTHVFFDKRTFTVWWVENVMGSSSKQFGWLVIMVDQVFHIITFAIVLHFL